MTTRRADVLSKGLPYLVAEDDAGQVVGFAYCQWFKPRPAYRYSAEDSIYMHPDATGKGLGKALLGELARQAQAAGIRKLIAVIGDSDNTGSIGVHRSVGFSDAGCIKSCGWKFGRWLDIVLMQMAIGEGDGTSPE
jgi:L-amino acid N-acyltransferase YncA